MTKLQLKDYKLSVSDIDNKNLHFSIWINSKRIMEHISGYNWTTESKSEIRAIVKKQYTDTLKAVIAMINAGLIQEAHSIEDEAFIKILQHIKDNNGAIGV